MADVLAGHPGIFPGNPLEPATPISKLSKQFYVQFPPWATLETPDGVSALLFPFSSFFRPLQLEAAALEWSYSGYDHPYLADTPPVGGPDRGCPSCSAISGVLLNMGV